jgi:hypothetical protein
MGSDEEVSVRDPKLLREEAEKLRQAAAKAHSGEAAAQLLARAADLVAEALLNETGADKPTVGNIIASPKPASVS